MGGFRFGFETFSVPTRSRLKINSVSACFAMPAHYGAMGMRAHTVLLFIIAS